MKTTIVLLGILITTHIFSQIPNGSFEEWEQESTWEVPIGWKTNNAEMGFVSVTKVESLSDGEYAMRVANRGLSFEGFDAGHAYCTFYPTGTYNQLELSYMIDSVSGGASIEILIFQLNSGQYEQIGSWQTENATNGIKDLNIPINLISNDSLQVEIRSNSLLTGTGQEGYSEIIVDMMELSLTSSTNNYELYNDIIVYPNPTYKKVMINGIKNKTPFILYNFEGQLIKSGFLERNAIDIDEKGVYNIKLKIEGKWVIKKIVVEK